jgi:DNA polymerase I-like protein with 3'-5' exonuclease and polymerase domains
MPEILTTKLPPHLSAHDSHQVYNGLDAGITLEVWHRLREELDREILRSHYANEESYQNALAWQQSTRINYAFERAMQGPALAMMRRGILVNQFYRWEVIAQLERRISNLEDMLNEFACAVWRKPLNANSHHQLKLFFYGAMKLPEQHSYVKGQRKTSINREALEKLSLYFLADPICSTIIRIRDLVKKLSVLRTEVDSDNRMRTSYNVAGPETGRWSSSSNVYGGGTNLQNITEELRRIFIADEGFKLAYIDLAQAESRCLAFLCYTLFGSTAYLDACESGDLHTLSAKLIWPSLGWNGEPTHDKSLAEQPFYHGFSFRDMAKRGGHASNYYGKPFTISRHLKVPQQLIESFQSQYFDAFPELREYHKWCARELQLRGQISTPLLTTRHFFGRVNDDSTLREAIAHVPQHMVGVLLNLALWRIWYHLDTGRTSRVQILAQVHDAVLLQYREEEEETISSLVLPLMATPLTFAGRTMTIPSDILVGWNWAKYYDEGKAAEDARRGRKPKPLNLDGIRGLGSSDSRSRREDPSARGLDRLIS